MSSINPNNINGSYPIAGQDNDSQGFRDNFTNIKNNLTFAKSELEDLQSKAILKSALSGSTLNNNLNYAQIISAQLLKTVETVNPITSPATGSVPVSWASGSYQEITSTSGSITVTFADWPTSGFFAKLRLAIYVSNLAHTITLASGPNYLNLSSVSGAAGNTITAQATGWHIFEFTTSDEGDNIFVEDLSRNYTSNLATSTFTTITVSTLANVTSTTAATSTSTGALKVAGGAGVVGNIHAGGNIVATGKFVGNLVGDVTGTLQTAAQTNITSVGTLTSVASSGAITSTGTGGVGYATGAGGTVTQGSGSAKNTTVVLNKTTGTITLNGGICFANAVTANSFTLTNSTIAATDLILVEHQSVGALGGYSFAATPSSGSAQIYVRNVTQTNLSEAIVLRFAVIKSVNA
jgi:hypothetical protein